MASSMPGMPIAADLSSFGDHGAAQPHARAPRRARPCVIIAADIARSGDVRAPRAFSVPAGVIGIAARAFRFLPCDMLPTFRCPQRARAARACYARLSAYRHYSRPLFQRFRAATPISPSRAASHGAQERAAAADGRDDTGIASKNIFCTSISLRHFHMPMRASYFRKLSSFRYQAA